MKNNLFSKAIVSIFSFVLIAAMALSFTACVESNQKGEVVDNTSSVSALTIGEGEKQFYLVVTDINGGNALFSVKTDEKTVGGALTSLEIVKGEQGSYGLFIKSVLGITADFDKTQTYWAFYIDGQYATSGIDTTDIEQGKTYELRVSK